MKWKYIKEDCLSKEYKSGNLELSFYYNIKNYTIHKNKSCIAVNYNYPENSRLESIYYIIS